MRNVIRVCIYAVLLLGTTVALAGDGHARLDREILHLTRFVAESGCNFIRNNKTHTPAQAVEHIDKKYTYFKADIDSAEKFIELSATQSTLTGRKYTIKCPGQDAVESREWLLEELRAFRSRVSK